MSILLSDYQPGEAAALVRLFYGSVHGVCLGDYTQEQVNVWADGTADPLLWEQTFLRRQTLVARLGGDISDFGATHEFILQRDIMLDFKMPWVALLGNHDCLGTGEDVFEEIWGEPNFYFQAGNVLFICLNTNCMEYDYSEPVPDLSFLERLMKNLPEGVERTVVVMHVPPFDLEFNNNVANVFQLYLKAFPNLMFCMNGHAHHYKINDFFDDGVLYYQTPCAKLRGYILFTITEDGYEHELIEF